MVRAQQPRGEEGITNHTREYAQSRAAQRMARAEPSSTECRTYFPILWASRLCLQQLYKSSRYTYPLLYHCTTIACTCMPTMQQCILNGIGPYMQAIHICFGLNGGKCSACLHIAAPPPTKKSSGGASQHDKVCVYIYIYVYMYVCMYVYIYIYVCQHEF